jgi:hypothetical protein
MKNSFLLFLLICLCMNATAQKTQATDSAFSKIMQNDDYSIYKKNPPAVQTSQLYIKDNRTNAWVEDTTKGKSNWELYNRLTAEGDNYFLEKNYEKALNDYVLAFKVTGDQGKVRHRYNAACCYAVLNKTELAFNELYRISTKAKYYNYHELESEKRFELLKADPRWAKLVEIVKKNADAIEEKLNLEIKQE